MSRPITEAQIRRITQEEVALYMLEEGMWDDVKNGAARLKKLVTQKFGKVAAKWGTAIKEKAQALSKLPPEIEQGIQALKYGMKESGESIKLDDTLKAAKELGQFNAEKANEVAQADLEGPVHDMAAKMQQGGTTAEAKYQGAVFSALLEGVDGQPEQLNEFGVTAAAGVGLAVLGGLPMLFKGLEKLAHALHADKLAHLFGKAEHVCHAVEVGAINAVVPNKLSYAAYKFLHKRGLEFHGEGGETVSFEDYVNDTDHSHAMKKVNGLLYKALLVYFAFSGLSGVLHAGASLIGFVEGAATTVKGVELARGAMEIAALAGKSA